MNTFAMNQVMFEYEDIAEAFPEIDPEVQPFGSRVLLQVRAPKTKTKGGLILTDEMQETERWNTQVAKVIAVGPLAFCNRQTGAKWPEGDWAAPGDFVRAPKYGGDRWSVTHKRGDHAREIIFVLLNDADLMGKVTGDPLTVKAFL
jgi:co-chaperonin GroES (HSP10)